MSVFKGEVLCQGPNEFLYKFEGNLKFTPVKQPQTLADFVSEKDFESLNIPLDANQLLLRGSSLRNTDYVYGIIVYTGHESKIMKNSPNCRNKLSKIERKTNRLIIFVFIIEILLCSFASIYMTMWNRTNKDSTDIYLGWSLRNNGNDMPLALSLLIGMATWLLIFSDFIPISLLVTLEFIKFFQAIFITLDAYLFDETKDMHAKVQSSNLTEELGQVEYIFSDKTGTLTQNIMEFK
jgi:phospholipid-transporting ATPase